MFGYRILFALAALYNVAFGLWAGFFPGAFFDLFDLEPPRYPAIWSCLGMVVGVYALAYLAIAIRPEHGTLLAAIGLLGKVLGPLGWVWSVRTGQLPPRTFPLILANDLVWWYPFTAYLLRNHARRRTWLAWVAIAANAVACVGLLAISAGTEGGGDMAARAEFVASHPARWAGVWVSWALASMGFLLFMSVWAGALAAGGALGGRGAILACGIAAIGVAADLCGETVNITVLTRPGISLDDFSRHADLYTLLGPATANGLYSVAGLILAWSSWRSGLLRGLLGGIGFVVWILGLTLTGAAFAGNRTLMVGAGAAVMISFLLWGFVAALRFTRPDATSGA